MSRFLHAGDVLLTSNHPDTLRYTVRDAQPIENCIKVFNSETLSENFISLDEINHNLQNRTWRVKPLNAAKVPLNEQVSPELASCLIQANQCLRMVTDTLKQRGVSFCRAYHLVPEELAATNDGQATPLPSRATLYRYFQAKRQDVALLRGPRNKGRRTPRYIPDLNPLITEMAERHFLHSHSRWRIGTLTEAINRIAKERKYISEAQNISARYITKVIRTSYGPDAEVRRMDPKAVAAARSIGAQRQMVQTPWERVEQDAVHMPFAVQTPHGISTDVWLLLAIDCASSMVVGWNLVVGHPTEDDSLQCIHTMINSKAPHFARLGLSYEFDIRGTPGLLVMDNGPETKGERIQKLALLDIEIQYCKSRHPHQKPFVERLNRSIKVALETLPGSTRMDGVDGTRNPIAIGERLMSVQELEIWIVRWCYESWAHHPLERLSHTVSPAKDILGKTPLSRWQHLVESDVYASTLPIPEDSWRQAMLVRSIRTVSRKTGITYEGLNFKGPELPWLVKHAGENSVTVLSDPKDYRFLYVDMGAGRPLVTLTEQWVQEDSPAYTFGEYKRLKAEREQATPASADVSQFRRDLLERAAQADAPTRRRKPAERNRDTTLKARQSAAIRRAADKPLPKKAAPEISLFNDSFNFDSLPSLELVDRNAGSKG